MTKTKIKNDLNKLAELDGDIKRELAVYGFPPPRVRPAGFEAFLRIIVSQQISTEAARAVFERVAKTVKVLDAKSIYRVEPEKLRAAGMSARKVEYAKGLAAAVVKGEFDPEAVKKQSDAEAVKSISSLRGFGIWSAEIYLMFSLGRRDIFAGGDLALRVALSKLKGRAGNPFTEAEARAAVEHWSPYRSSGCLFLWHYYRGAPQ